MMEHQQTTTANTYSGPIGGLAGIVKNMFGLLVSRIELAALEFGEIRASFFKLILISIVGVLLAWLALICWTTLVVVLAWPVWGWKILLLVAAVFTVVAVGMLCYAYTMLRREKWSLPATMAELRNDRDALL